jgi:shikimate kinase
VARELARRLGCEAIDLDPLIAARAKKSIAAIFADDGEGRFRELETEVLREELSRREARILAPGGGAVLRQENRELIRESNALVVYLAARPETLARRVEKDATTTARDRPPLVPGGFLAEARALLEKREPVYRELAQVAIETDALSLTDVAERIALELKRGAG